VEYDPFSDEVLDDPNPVYARLRREAPVYHLEKYDAYALARFQDIWDVSSDPVAYSVRRGTSAPQLLSKVLPPFPNLNHMDPPQHTALRKDVWQYFSPRAVLVYEDRLRRAVLAKLDELLPSGRFDVMNDLAFPVSAKMACIAMGFPEEDSDGLVSLVQRFFGREQGVVGMGPKAMAAYAEMEAYLQELARTRIEQGVTPDNPVDTLLAAPEIDDEVPSLETRASHLMLLLTGSTETFPKTFASALFRLWQHPDQRAEVTADLSLVPDAYDEVLRYDMPTQFLCRMTLREVEISGVRIPKDRPVLMLYPSGNRDELEFDEPDRFDIHRRAERILTFGHGVHRCLGIHFAKLEGRVMLTELLRAVPDYEVDVPSSERLRTEFVQGFAVLPIEFQPH
jgi:cytochrome P450